MASTTTFDEASKDLELKIAIAAAVLAGGAFLIAFLQAFLQYHSSSVSRPKCTRQAIGFTANNVRIGWDWRMWKLTAKYPLIDMSFDKVMRLMVETHKKEAINGALSPVGAMVKSHHADWEWTAVRERDPLDGVITDGYTKLRHIRSGLDVTQADLTWAEFAVYWRWRLNHNCTFNTRPRASWAQLLIVFAIRDARKLVYRHVDADLIPGPIDVPVQRVRLYDLGLLCLRMGFKKVSIEPRDREFKAYGELGSVTTLDVKGQGKMLHFEGDILAIIAQFSKRDHPQSMEAHTSIDGTVAFGPVITDGGVWAIHLLAEMATKRWSKEAFKKAEEEYLHLRLADDFLRDEKRGNMVEEARLFSTLYNTNANLPTTASDPRRMLEVSKNSEVKNQHEKYRALRQALHYWQKPTGLKIPTIFAGSVLANSCAWETGFPSDRFLKPLMPWVAQIVKGIQRELLVHPYLKLDYRFAHDKVGRTHCDPPAWYMAGRSLPNIGWVFKEMKQVYDGLDMGTKQAMIGRHGNTYTGEVNPVLIGSCFRLLERLRQADQDPKLWAFPNDSSDSICYKEGTNSILWAQLLLLDVAIHFLVRGGWHTGPRETYDIWKPEVAAVLNAVVDSLTIGSPPPRPGASCASMSSLASIALAIEDGDEGLGLFIDTYSWDCCDKPDCHARDGFTWDLFGSLQKQDVLFKSSPLRRQRLRRLAILLKLRAIFRIALWMMVPDSSDVYAARKSQVEMPMI